MKLRLDNAGKRFGSEWIFRGVNLELKEGGKYALLGRNGSGKSTLAQVIAGYLSLSEGTLHHGLPSEEEHPLRVSFASPYLDLPDEYSPAELSAFHFSMRAPLHPGVPSELSKLLQLDHARLKPIRSFSSGMKQRMKLGLAVFTASELLIVDEPFTNLDAEAKQWFIDILTEHLGNRTLVICSNHQPEEYAHCDEILEMSSWKPAK